MLRATDTEWSHGTGAGVSGPILSLVMVMTGRKEPLDDLSGDGVGTLRSRSLVVAAGDLSERPGEFHVVGEHRAQPGEVPRHPGVEVGRGRLGRVVVVSRWFQLAKGGEPAWRPGR